MTILIEVHGRVHKICVLTRGAMHVSRNTEARSGNHCCCGKVVLHIDLCVRARTCVRVCGHPARGRVNAHTCM